MADKHEKLLSELEFRLHQLMYLCDSLKEENLDLKNQLEEKRLETELVNAKLEELNSKYNNLKFANTITSGDDSESVEKAKKRLLKLVQDVDKCIALLKI